MELSLTGRMHFDPPAATKKNEAQSSWKNVAVLLFPGDDHLYYAWLIHRRYGLRLNRPLRRFHVTFVNDRAAEMRPGEWDRTRAELEGMAATVRASVDVRTNGEHWWLRVTEASELSAVRVRLGLRPVPFWSFHASVGYASDRQLVDSERIHRMILSGMTC